MKNCQNDSKVELDFKEIADIILENFTAEFTRCHEMSYIINEGMKIRGYDSVTKHGFYFSSFPPLSFLVKAFMDHSWVEVKPNGIILDSYCNRPAFEGEDVWSRPQFEVVKRRRDKVKYVPWRIKYKLAEGIEDVPKMLFG
jgi:hypothetical protein